jgi:hypothetical protein
VKALFKSRGHPDERRSLKGFLLFTIGILFLVVLLCIGTTHAQDAGADIFSE